MKLTKKRLQQIIAEEKARLTEAPKTNAELLHMSLQKLYDADKFIRDNVTPDTQTQALYVLNAIEDVRSYISQVEQDMVVKAIGGRTGREQ